MPAVRFGHRLLQLNRLLDVRIDYFAPPDVHGWIASVSLRSKLWYSLESQLDLSLETW